VALLFEILENLATLVILYYYPAVPEDYVGFRKKCVVCKFGVMLLFAGTAFGSMLNILMTEVRRAKVLDQECVIF
jgi:hypothetical protein